ncbi:MAG: nucleotide disphospho-sugar-binding domain-containing protein [Terriglobia bacterium]
MSRFLFTMVPANDLGLPSRLVPIARALADRGHEVAMFNPAPAPARLIEDAGLKNLPMPSPPMPVPGYDPGELSSAWDLEQMYATMYSDEEYARADTAFHVDLVRNFDPDIVVDSFGLPTCLAARILRIPLASVLQGNFHPASSGFLWWKGERPAGLPSAVGVINKLAKEYGVAPVARCVDLLAGDLSLIVGTPETDPLPASAHVTYVGPILWQRGNLTLPDWVGALSRDKPVIWVYSGNPRYGSASTPLDSIVVIRAAIAALGDAPVQVVLTTGYQEMPREFGALPSNFRHAAYLPGRAMAERCDLMVHHGGHGSVMTGLAAGTPAVIIPTITERESNARRVMALGAGEIVVPVDGADGEKHIDVADFSAKVHRVLAEPSYRRSARRVAESMRRFGGIQDAADRIERFVVGKP